MPKPSNVLKELPKLSLVLTLLFKLLMPKLRLLWLLPKLILSKMLLKSLLVLKLL